MPIYEYRCIECHQVFEEWCKHADDGKKPRSCPICKGNAKRLISHTSFALKGGGWYATEYGPQKKQAEADTSQDAAQGETPAPASALTEGKNSAAPALAVGG